MNWLKKKLRRWFFADYRWVTRAEVQQHIGAAQWEYRDYPLVQRALAELKEVIR